MNISVTIVKEPVGDSYFCYVYTDRMAKFFTLYADQAHLFHYEENIALAISKLALEKFKILTNLK